MLCIVTRCWSSLPAAEFPFPSFSGGSIKVRDSASRRSNRHACASQQSCFPRITIVRDERCIVSSLEEAIPGAALGTWCKLLCVVSDALKRGVLAGLGDLWWPISKVPLYSPTWTSLVWETSIANNPKPLFFETSLVRCYCSTIFVVESRATHGVRRVTCACMITSWDFLLVSSIFSSSYSWISSLSWL